MKKLKHNPKSILISRTDSIGDVVLTLPLCYALKQRFPETKLYFLASAYTIPVLKCCSAIDEIIDYSNLEKKETKLQVTYLKSLNVDVLIHVFPRKKIAKIARKAAIPFRIGTSHRLYNLLTCNVRVDFTRKSSPLHESQLNFALAQSLGIERTLGLNEISGYMAKFRPTQLTEPFNLDQYKEKCIILHPKSQGSAVEWAVDNYSALANALSKKGYKVFVTGTEKEGLMFRSDFNWSDRVIDTSGKMSLEELIAFISKVDFLVACSTGPLHIAGALDVPCLGLFSPRKPLHPGRWQPIGTNSNTLVSTETCPCASKEECRCLQNITVEAVLEKVLEKLN